MIDGKKLSEALRDFRLNELAKIVPGGERAPTEHCACGKPARHERGRHSGRMFVVPMECGHHVYLLGEHPAEASSMTYAELMQIQHLCRQHEAQIAHLRQPRKLSVVERLERLERLEAAA